MDRGTTLSPPSRSPSGSRVFALFVLLLLPAMITLSFDYGSTWDEKARQKYGETVWEYLAGARDETVFETSGPAYQLYGGLFDVVCVAAQKALPHLDKFVVRHAANAAFGWLAVFSCGLLARHLFGPWRGVLAMVLLVLSPRFLAHCMNNPKDLPFAALATLATYYIFKLGPAYPYVGRSLGVKLTFAIAAALAIRASGLLLLAYLGAALAIRTVLSRDFSIKHLAATAGRLTAITISAILMASVFWPWALVRPLYGPALGLLAFSKFDWGGTVLFEGASIAATQLPWDYLPTWLLISTPFVLLIGAACSPLWTRTEPAEGGRAAVAAVWALYLFPIVFIGVRGCTLYDGPRHVLFLTPLLAVLAATGWAALLRHRRSVIRRCSAAALCLALLEPLAFVLGNHPNEVVYFNALTGGPAGAFGSYDLDYWGNCSLQAVRWTADLAEVAEEPIVVTGGPSPNVEVDALRFNSVAFRPPQRRQHHVAILLLRGSAAEVREMAARQSLFRVTTADGAPLCVVLPGPRFDELATRLADPRFRAAIESEKRWSRLRADLRPMARQ